MFTAPTMAASIAGVFPPEMENLIKESKILLVGAGGIGCEVLKNLVLTGFSDLEIIDLDTIEVSNLNRQFLFNKQSVGKAKSHVARESVLKFNPNVNIKSYLGDIMDQSFGSSFFNKFKLVINALDNRKARAHVNRMCLSVDIPLIESGTMGYSGQVEFIKKRMSLCYECLPKPERKFYPMCTIRNTPKETIHCIVWAKFLFNQLFGEQELLGDDVSVGVIPDNDKLPILTARQWAVNNDYEPLKLMKKIFIDDIEYLLIMKDLFTNQARPIPLSESLINGEYAAYNHEPDFKILDVPQYVSMLKDSIINIKIKLDQVTEKKLIWDKDDDDFMNFVVSCANLRSTIFKIPMESHFEIKSKAGNIIPAIATANAMVAGQIVIHALRVLRGNYERCQSVFLRARPNHKGAILVKDRKLQPPNPKCNVCSVRGLFILRVDLRKFTVKQLDELVLKKKLNMVLPDVMSNGRLVISSDDLDCLDLYSSSFHDIKVTHGSRLTIDDYFQNYSVNIMVLHKEKKSDEQPDFELFNKMEDLKNHDENLKSKKQNIVKTPINKDVKDNDCVIESNVNASEIDNQSTSCHSNEPPRKAPFLMTEEIETSDEQEASEDSDDQEVSNEEVLAYKRKAANDEETSVSKKSRTDE